MKVEFNSEAFEANKYLTRPVNEEFSFQQEKFLELSKSYWGINNATQEFLKEFNHPYSNYKFLSEQIKKIALDNIWLYIKSEEYEFAIDMIIEFFRTIYQQCNDLDVRESLLHSYLQLFDLLAEDTTKHINAINSMLDVMNLWADTPNNDLVFVENSGNFKTHLNVKYESLSANDAEQIKIKIRDITKRSLILNLQFWAEHTDIEFWYAQKQHLFGANYTDELKSVFKNVYLELLNKLSTMEAREEIIREIPSFKEIANYFRLKANTFQSPSERIYYLFYLLYLPGMSHLKDHLLWDINKLMKNITSEMSSEQILEFFDQSFTIFNELKTKHQGTILDCITTLGKVIADSGDLSLIHALEAKIIDLGFIVPGEIYLTEDWQIHRNTNHVKNIRSWMELVESAPVSYSKLLSALIVNLRLGGIFISDTDLFQKDVSHLLNSPIEPIYKQVKQLCRAFPVYFNEIGAEGELREVSTVMDELSMRKDRLLHFMRKQVHTESNNTHIELSKKILRFWLDGDKSKLEKHIPDDVFECIDLEHRWFTGVHYLIKHLHDTLQVEPENLVDVKEHIIAEALDNYEVDNDIDKKRIKLFLRLQVLLKEKYSFSTKNIISILKRYSFFKPEEIDLLSDNLVKQDLNASLNMTFDFMDRLNQVVFNPEKTESWENIYYKRHVAVGIPSMYGEYHEKKFEALGLIFRLERLSAKLIDKLIAKINFNYLNANSLHKIYNILVHFNRGMELDGIHNQVFRSNMQMFQYSLTSKSFSLGQYINILQFIHTNIQEIINKYFFRIYDPMLKTVIPQLHSELNSIDEKSRSQFMHKKSEEFYREALTSAYLLQSLDNFLSISISTLREMNDNYPPEVISDIMSYNHESALSPLYAPTPALDNPIFLGSKAYFLKKLFAYGFPVPPGFVFTTEVFRLRQAIIKVPQISIEMDELIRSNLKILEDMTGLEYGNPEKPLLLSVRSGTAISMPGAMSTFLNVGMNDEIVEQLSHQPNYAWTSWDSYRRFLQSWGMSYGIDRDIFDRIMLDYKQKYNVAMKQHFKGEQMREIAFAYKDVLYKNEIPFIEDTFEQLKQAIRCVLDSWSGTRAKVYREHLNISREWGTAVAVQKMVLGNIHLDSGTGVVFTHSPDDPTAGVNLYGDFTLCSQGEDVVGGLVNVLPISEAQREKSFGADSLSLQKDFPEIYNRLLHYATLMTEEYGFNHQEIEFTFESSKAEDLYILQTRDQIIRRAGKSTVFGVKKSDMQLVGSGIGTGGGAMNGRVAFNLEDINRLKAKYPNEHIILIRPDTVPDDIDMIFECDGLLTGKGGATSHAAVTAVRLGKTCIVNCLDLQTNEKMKRCRINENKFFSGDMIAIDGYTGNIYNGNYPVNINEAEN